MQRDLLKNYPDLEYREDRETGDFVLKKSLKLKEETLKSLHNGHNFFKKLYLYSGSEKVLLNLEIVQQILGECRTNQRALKDREKSLITDDAGRNKTNKQTPLLSTLLDDLKLRCCCCAPHNQVDVILDQVSPHLLYLLKNLLESGRCVTNSETEQELKDLIHALGMSDLAVYNRCLVSKPSINLHREGEMSLIVSTDIKVQNIADEDDFESPDLTTSVEEVNRSAIDLNENGQLEKRLYELEERVNELEKKGNGGGVREVRRPQRRLPRDKWEQRCSICQQYFDSNELHDCNRKRTRSMAEENELQKDDTKIMESYKRDESSENNSDHELEEYIEGDSNEPTKKSIKLYEFVNNPSSPQTKLGRSISKEHKESCVPSLEESNSTGFKVCSTKDSLLPEETSGTEESSINIGDMAYAMCNNHDKEFKKCKIIGKNTRTSPYKIQFELNRSKKATPNFPVTGKQLAYLESPKDELKVGTRCIAIYEERFFPAIVLESPTKQNDERYLIYFVDDGYWEYFPLENLRKMVDQAYDVWKDGFCDPEFIENYLKDIPNNLELSEGDQVEMFNVVEERWVGARVVDVDASLVLIDYGGKRLREWVYRGPPRLRLKSLDSDCDKKMLFKENEIVPCQLCEDSDYKEQNLSEHLYRKHENLKKRIMRDINTKTSIYTMEKEKTIWTCSLCGEDMKGTRTVVGFHLAVEHQQIKILYDSDMREKNEQSHPTDETVNSNNESEVCAFKADIKAPINDEPNLKDREIKESSSEQTENHKLTTDYTALWRL